MSFSSMIKNSISLIVLVAIVYILNTILYFYLPKNGIDDIKQQDSNLEYRKYKIKRAFEEVKSNDDPTIKVVKNDYQLLSNISLKAVYLMSEEKGWIILEDKSEETFMLSVSQSHEGYELKRIYLHYVVFAKNGVEYKIELKEDENVNYSVTKSDKSKNTKIKKNDKDEETLSQEIEENIFITNDKVLIQRSYLNSYIGDFDKIWKNISIKEVKNKDGKINGFKIVKISKNSVFKKLGLHKGDIIQSINNVELTSYNDAFNVYKKINKIDNLHIKVLRNGKEVELDYEIE